MEKHKIVSKLKQTNPYAIIEKTSDDSHPIFSRLELLVVSNQELPQIEEDVRLTQMNLQEFEKMFFENRDEAVNEYVEQGTIYYDPSNVVHKLQKLQQIAGKQKQSYDRRDLIKFHENASDMICSAMNRYFSPQNTQQIYKHVLRNIHDALTNLEKAELILNKDLNLEDVIESLREDSFFEEFSFKRTQTTLGEDYLGNLIDLAENNYKILSQSLQCSTANLLTLYKNERDNLNRVLAVRHTNTSPLILCELNPSTIAKLSVNYEQIEESDNYYINLKINSIQNDQIDHEIEEIRIIKD